MLSTADFEDQLPQFMRELNPLVYLSGNYVVVDFETTNLDKGSPYNPENSIVFVSWELGPEHPASDVDSSEEKFGRWKSEFELSELVEHCEQADFVVAHNAKFELGWLERCGLDISRVLPFCTQIAEYVIAGNRDWNLKLESCLERHGFEGKESVVSALMDAGVCPSEMPEEWLEEYGYNDTAQEHKLFRSQLAILQHQELLPVVLTRNIFTAPLVDIEHNGMFLDKERVLKVAGSYYKKKYALEKELDDLSGGINPRSSKQKREFIYGALGFEVPKDYRGEPIVTSKGEPSTNKDVLAQLKPKTKRQREFLRILSEINKVDAAISKALGKFQKCVEETDDHILTASLNQTITDTHRLSSTGKNYKAQFQNFPNAFKPLFAARHEGWEVAEIDEAQLEYRTAVFLGQDEAGMHSIINDVDRHAVTASIIFKEEWEKNGADKKNPVCKELRGASKPHTFKPLYGGKSGTDREREYYQAFCEEHKGVTKAQEEWLRTVYQKRVLKTVTGLRFYWTNSKINRRGMLIQPNGKPADQSICNYPVQSLATAEMVPIAVTYLWHFMRLAEMESFLVNTIHDSAIAEVKPDEKELFGEFAVKSFTDYVIHYLREVYDIEFNVPLEAELEFNSHWADSEYWRQENLGEK